MNETSGEGKKLQAVFFQYLNGSRPVHDWLMSLNREDRKAIGAAIGTVEFEWPIGPPLVKKVGQIWEVRAIVATGWARVSSSWTTGKCICCMASLEIEKSLEGLRTSRLSGSKCCSI